MTYSCEIIHRLIAAIFGGYLLSNLNAILFSYLLPGSQASAVMAGMQLSFPIYAMVVIWVFSVTSVRLIWVGILVPIVIMTPLALALMPKGIL